MVKATNAALSTFRKNNKQRREVIAKAKGYTSAAEYEKSLTGTTSSPGTNKKSTTKKKVTTAEKPTIHNVHILDASGSMHGNKLKNAVSGINEEVKFLKTQTDVNYTNTLVSFSSNDDIQVRQWLVPINQAKTINETSRNTTALNQAVGETLEKLYNSSNGVDKYLVKIFTDGGENDSKGKYASNSTLRELISKCEKKGFTITFVGTAGDVANVQASLHIAVTNSLVHDNTSQGVAASFTATREATQLYSKKVLAKEDVTEGFYTKKTGTL